MQIKRAYLILAFAMASVIALLYGISPPWFATTFLGMTELPTNIAHILRAIMCLYLALACFWLFSAFSDSHRNSAVLTTIVFSAGTRDGPPSQLLDRWPARPTVDFLCCYRTPARADSGMGLHASRVTVATRPKAIMFTGDQHGQIFPLHRVSAACHVRCRDCRRPASVVARRRHEASHRNLRREGDAGRYGRFRATCRARRSVRQRRDAVGRAACIFSAFVRGRSREGAEQQPSRVEGQGTICLAAQG